MDDEIGEMGDMGEMGENLPPLPKPSELLALDTITADMFDTLRGWFGVGPTVELNLAAVDSAVTELGDPKLIAAMAMRKLQALNLLSTPGVTTTTDVVVAIVQDLDRALLAAPELYLNLAAESTDWDQAFAAMDNADEDEIVDEANELDPEIEHFRQMHGELHEAMYAVLEASDGVIRFFE